MSLTSLLRGEGQRGGQERDAGCRVAAQHVHSVLHRHSRLAAACGRHENEVAPAARGLHRALLVASQHLGACRARRLGSPPAEGGCEC